MKTRIENHKIRAFGIAYDVRIRHDNLVNESSAIAIDIIHCENKNLPRCYFAYSWTKENVLSFGENYGVERKTTH